MRRLMPLLILFALLAAPYGRAQAQAAADHRPAMTMAGHCDPAPAKAPAPAHHGSIDCTIACAGIPSVNAAFAGPPLPPVAAMTAPQVLALDGVLPQFDPPPPR